jgi:hypothetical protein
MNRLSSSEQQQKIRSYSHNYNNQPARQHYDRNNCQGQANQYNQQQLAQVTNYVNSPQINRAIPFQPMNNQPNQGNPVLNQQVPQTRPSQNTVKESNRKRYYAKKKSHNLSPTRPIRGKAIFNKTLVEYLYDGGADRTTINTQLYNQIKQDDNTTSQLQPYANKSLESANGPMDVAGVLKLNRCILGDKTTN